MIKRAFAICLLACIGVILRAQDYSNHTGNTLRLPFNLAFVPGISVADLVIGMEDREVEVSGINLGVIGSRIDRLNGISLGGVFGEVTRDAMGGEWSGVFNVVGGDARGMMVAGVFNVARQSMGGLQGAGVFNTAATVGGFQGAGVFNVNEDGDLWVKGDRGARCRSVQSHKRIASGGAGRWRLQSTRRGWCRRADRRHLQQLRR